jgi:lysophospholipase L1-like esterase
VLFRLLAVAVGLLPLVVLELALRGLGLGKPTDYSDPFVGFSDIHPLFVLDAETNRYEIPLSRQTHFRPESFPAVKPAGQRRIFVLGGSTVQGRPYAIETSFTTWLELSLNAAEAGRSWDVVNCGGLSYASYRLVPILQEVLTHQPDLIVVCTGQNEFLEDRSYAHIKSASPLLAWPQRQISRLRTYTLFRDGSLRLTGNAARADSRPTQLGAEADAMLDWKHGLARYHRDDAWHAAVAAHFDFNLRRIVQIAEDAGVPLVIVNPISNLDWPPFKPEHRADITSAERAQFDKLLKRAGELAATDAPAALVLLKEAAKIDEQHAQVWYEIGMIQESVFHWSEARAALVRAKELDVCPLRMPEALHETVLRVADETGTPLVDATALIAAESRTGYLGHQWLIDHVHPTIAGHQLIAAALFDKLAELSIVRPPANFAAARDAAYKQHLAGLGHAYFERGKTRFNSVQNWAHGRVEKTPPSSHETSAAATAHGLPAP